VNRTLVRFSFSLVFLGFLLACTPSPDPLQKDQGVTLVFKHGKIAGAPEIFPRLLRRFEAEHPGIRVRDETLPSSTDQQHQFYVMSLEGGSDDFDVLSLDVIWVQEFAKAQWIRDLSSLLPPEDQALFFPGPIKAVSFDDKIYAIPWYIDAGLLYYRKDLLDKYDIPPPLTWNELLKISKWILAEEKDPNLKGFVWQGKQYEGLICNILEYIWSAGGSVFDEEGNITLSSPEAEQALNFAKDLIGNNKISPPMVTTADEEATRRIFGEGRAIFMRNWPYAWKLFQNKGSPIRGKVGVTVLPHFQDQKSAATLGGWQLGINRASKYPKEAEALVRFLTSPEIQLWMALEIGYKPPRRELYHNKELIASQPFIAGLAHVFETAKPRPTSPYYLMLSQIMQPEFSAALVGLKEPREALKSAQRQMHHILSATSGN